MMDESGWQLVQPAGYCPKCGYALNPGRCPECGTEVTATTIEPTPPPLNARRWMKRGKRALVVAVVAFAGYQAYQAVAWLPLLPTSWLLAFQGDAKGKCLGELWNRFEAGKLAKAESDRMFAGIVEFPTTLDAPPKFPASQSMIVRYRTRVDTGEAFANRPCPLCERWNQICVRVDGKRVPEGEFAIHYSGFEPNIEIVAPPAGKHVITFAADFVMRQCMEPEKEYLKRAVSASCEVETDERPVKDHIAAVWDRSIRNVVQKCVEVQIRADASDAGQWVVEIAAKRPPVPLVGWLEIRMAGTKEFERIDQYSLSSAIFLPAEGNWCSIHWTRWRSKQGDADRVDIRFVPSPIAALNHGLPSYFAGVIEWNDIPVKTSSDYRSILATHDGIAPTRIVPWKPGNKSD